MNYLNDYDIARVATWARWLPHMLNELQDRFPAEAAPIYTMHAREGKGELPMRVVGANHSIGSTVSDAIVRGWLWLTATRIYPLGYFSRLLQAST